MKTSRSLLAALTITSAARYCAAQTDADANPPVAEATPPAAAPARTSSIPLSVRVTVGSREWTFSAAAEGGVRVDFRNDGVERQYVLDCGGACRQIEGLAACGYDAGSGAMLGLGVASRSADGQRVEYRMLFARNANEHSPAAWIHSDPLITADAQDPFDLMAVSLSHGDSLMLTLQRLARVGNGGTIDTHTFVNHCPVAANGVMLNDGIITHAGMTAQLNSDPDTEHRTRLKGLLDRVHVLEDFLRDHADAFIPAAGSVPERIWLPAPPDPPYRGPDGRWIIDYRWFEKPGKWLPADR